MSGFSWTKKHKYPPCTVAISGYGNISTFNSLWSLFLPLDSYCAERRNREVVAVFDRHQFRIRQPRQTEERVRHPVMEDEAVETPEELLAKQHRKEKKDLQGG